MKSINLLTLLALVLAPSVVLAQQPGEVILYDDKGAGGKSVTISLEGKEERLIPLIDQVGFENDALSSLKVGSGVKVSLYDDKGCREDQTPLILYAGDAPRLLDWNDVVSSLKLEKVSDNLPIAKFYSDTNAAEGSIQCLGPGFYDGDNFVDNDLISMITVPQGLIVTVYTDSGRAGQSKQLTGGENQMMDPWGLDDDISSIEITMPQYRLLKMDFTNETIIEKGLEDSMGGEDYVENSTSSAEVEKTKTLERTYQCSATTSWENATTMGVVMTTTVSANVDIVGLGGGSVERSIATELSNTFSFGKAETKTTSQTLSDSVTVKVPAGQKVKVWMVATPVVKQYDVVYTFVPDLGKDESGQYKDHTSSDLKPYTMQEKVTLKLATDVRVKTEDYE